MCLNKRTFPLRQDQAKHCGIFAALQWFLVTWFYAFSQTPAKQSTWSVDSSSSYLAHGRQAPAAPSEQPAVPSWHRGAVLKAEPWEEQCPVVLENCWISLKCPSLYFGCGLNKPSGTNTSKIPRFQDWQCTFAQSIWLSSSLATINHNSTCERNKESLLSWNDRLVFPEVIWKPKNYSVCSKN